MATAIVYKTVNFPDGFLGVAYEAAIGYVDPAGTLTVADTAVHTGALPTGLVVNADGVRITGTPTAEGVFTFTLTMTDGGGAGISASHTITVHGPVYVAGGRITEQADPGSTLADDLAIEWSS